MTPTRLSKIARLPANLREQLNHRLHDGELSRTIIPWINELPETKKVITELYRGKPITHQNLSEWRHTGYQDWLLHQQRLEWNERLAEEEAQVTEQNRCEDGYEAMGFQFLYEISQALKAIQQIKNPNQRWDRLETLTREFCRLQNAFNWSRRVSLEFDKANHRFDKPSGTGVSPVSPRSHGRDARATSQTHTVTGRDSDTGIRACGSPGLSSSESKTPSPVPNSHPSATALATAETQESTVAQNSSSPISPSPNSDLRTPNSNLPSPITSSTPTPFRPLPTLAPPTPRPPIPTPKSHPPSPNSYLQTSSPRGRRFICIEG